jgi:Tfp pilus assembly protein PilZ
MNLTHRVRGQLILSRQLLTRAVYQPVEPGDSSRLAHDLIVCYGAAELALAAICVQLDCLPGKRDICLHDYFDSLRKAVRLDSVAPGMQYVAELHQVRSDSQLRSVPPDPRRWNRAMEETLEQISIWCQHYLDLRLLDLDSVPTISIIAADSRPEQSASSKEQLSALALLNPERRRFDCAGSAEIRLALAARPEKGRMVNLSLGGCYVKTEFIFEVGEKVEMILEVNKVSFRAAGSVVHIPPSGAIGNGKVTQAGIGIQFSDMTAGARSRLQELIAELRLKI